MRDRCYNKNCERYADYGGRGIVACDEWATFEGFLADMGEKPKGMTLGRVDNNNGYDKGNCRWETYTEQNKNKRGYRNNTSGYKGVSWNKRQGKWQAYVCKEKRQIALGYFTDAAEAAAARKRYLEQT